MGGHILLAITRLQSSGLYDERYSSFRLEIIQKTAEKLISIRFRKLEFLDSLSFLD